MDILGCTGTVSQRAAVLHKLIQLARALKDHAHDLYSFSAVMKALEMPQVSNMMDEKNRNWFGVFTGCFSCLWVQIARLEMTWRTLRQNHTEMAVLFEKTLKPFMNLLNEGDSEFCSCNITLYFCSTFSKVQNRLRLWLSICLTRNTFPALAQSFCIYALVFCVDSAFDGPIAVPHLVPLLMAMEGDDPVENSERGCQLLYNILQSARNAAVHAHDYQQHANALLTGVCAQIHTRELVLVISMVRKLALTQLRRIFSIVLFPFVMLTLNV